MGSTKSVKSLINEKLLLRSSMINERELNDVPTKERDYMIERAMKRLGISSEWRRAVARGANYLPPAEFWRLVEDADRLAKQSKARYFVASVGKELAKL